MKVSNDKHVKTGHVGPESVKAGKLGRTGSIRGGESDGEAGEKATVTSGTRIDLSPRAHELRKAKELAKPSESIDELKVARLQKMIDEGKYKVDADAVAGRILDEHGKMPS